MWTLSSWGLPPSHFRTLNAQPHTLLGFISLLNSATTRGLVVRWMCTRSDTPRLSYFVRVLTMLQRSRRIATAGLLQTRSALVGTVVDARGRLQTSDLVHSLAQGLGRRRDP